jgi:hypothetical protein
MARRHETCAVAFGRTVEQTPSTGMIVTIQLKFVDKFVTLKRHYLINEILLTGSFCELAHTPPVIHQLVIE